MIGADDRRRIVVNILHLKLQEVAETMRSLWLERRMHQHTAKILFELGFEGPRLAFPGQEMAVGWLVRQTARASNILGELCMQRLLSMRQMESSHHHLTS